MSSKMNFDSSLLNLLGVGVVALKREDYSIVHANLEMENLSFYPLSELQKMNFLQLIAKQDQEKFLNLAQLKTIDKSYVLRDNEFSIRRRSGKRSSVTLSLQLVSDQDILLVTVTDNNPRKKLETELETVYSQMIETSKFISLAEMAAGIAHEINNPLAIIHGYAEKIEQLAKKNQHADYDDVAKKMQKNVMRASKIIKSLRTFSHSNSSEQYEPVEIGKILENADLLCRQRFLNEGVNLEVQIDESFSEVYCDESQLLQVFINLMDNGCYAAKASENPLVKVSTLLEGEQVIIRVEDSGVGVPEDIKNEIMNPFYTTKPVGEGTGLGLSISRNIVEKHHGQLTLNREVSASCFQISLPIHKEKKMDTGEELVKEIGVNSSDLEIDREILDECETSWQEKVVLIVEDEDEMNKLLGTSLLKEGFQIIQVSDGIEAMEVMEKQTVDLILSDFRMPNMNGLELLNKIRKDPRESISSTKYFMLTGTVDVPFSHLFQSGAEGVFTKPIETSHIINRIKLILTPTNPLLRRQTSRISFRQAFEVSFPTGSPEEGQVVNLGRGGMFIKMKKALPMVGELIHFDLKVIDHNKSFHVAGKATVRWTREHGDDHGPRGAGVEFFSIESGDAQAFLSFLNKMMVAAYIPTG